MRNYIKPLMIVAAMASSFSALAIQKDITVNASVDSQLDMTQADNTPLPASTCSTCQVVGWKATA